MKTFLVLALLGLGTAGISAEPHTWRDAEGSSTFKAEYLSQNEKTVTVKKANGTKQTFDKKILHIDDLAWLKKIATPEKAISQGTAFDSLSFGDTRQTVEKKLNASNFVTTKVEKAFMGRTGLNGVYQTTKKIGDLSCFLYFDWDEDGGLKEITLHSELVDGAQYDSKVKSTWSEMAELLAMIHGKPLQTSSFPSAQKLEDGAILSSHLWHTAEGNSVLMGTGQEKGKYGVTVRITTAKIEPIATN